MNYSSGITIDGKTYRDLVPQVYYLTEKVEELIAGGGGSAGGSGIYSTSVFVQPIQFVLDESSTLPKYVYTLPFTQFERPSFFFTTAGTNLGTLQVYPSVTDNAFVLTSYSRPTWTSISLYIWAYETDEGSWQTVQDFLAATDLNSITPRYITTIEVPTSSWSGSSNNYSSTIYTSRFTGYFAHGLTLFVPVGISKYHTTNCIMYIQEGKIFPGTSITLKSTTIPPSDLQFYVYSIPIPDQTEATVALV